MRRGLGYLFLFLSLAACTSSTDQIRLRTSHGHISIPRAQTLRTTVFSEPPSLDWHLATDTTSAMIIVNMMDGLTAFDVSSPKLELVGGLAERWETPDQKEWTFFLRRDVKWSDGVAFTAHHARDGMHRILAPETASQYAYMVFPILNAKEFNSGGIKDFSQVGVKVIDDHTIKFTLTAPLSYFPLLLAHQSSYPVRQDIVDKYGDKWTEPEHIVTLGAYTLEHWKHDEFVLLKHNPSYFLGAPKIQRVLVRILDNASTGLRLYTSNQLDVMSDLPSLDVRWLRKRADYHSAPNLRTYYFGFNITKPPMDNLNVRKALVMAVDRTEITRLLDAGQVPLSGWLPSTMLGADPDIGLKYNPKKAKELLRKAGYENPEKMPKIRIGFNTNPDHQLIAENIQAQWRRNLGIQVELENQEWKTYLNVLHTDPLTVYRSGWQADFNDPDNFMVLMTGASENNSTRWKNPEYDRLVLQAARETNTAKRIEIYKQAQKLMLEQDVPVMPIYSAIVNYLIRPNVKNFSVNSLDYVRFYKVEMNDE